MGSACICFENSLLVVEDREKQLKRWVRRKKIALIESRNPRWADLAEHWGAQMPLPVIH